MPIAIIQNNINDAPAYLETWLRARGESFTVFHAYTQAALPQSLDGFSGLAILGGPMSVNDPLPELRQQEHLIRDAARQRKPVIGHCLGGQLIASAFGAQISKNPVPEIGWSKLMLSDTAPARDWFGPLAGTSCAAFEWHYDTFALPEGASKLAASTACVNQAFAIERMLAMQFHIEVDAQKLAIWAEQGAHEINEQLHHASVQSAEMFMMQAEASLAQSLALADQIYSQFLRHSRT